MGGHRRAEEVRSAAVAPTRRGVRRQSAPGGLHAAAGNRAVARAVQRALVVGHAHDRSEQEAEAVAREVVAALDDPVAGGELDDEVSGRIVARAGGGSPLDRQVAAEMGSAFGGVDFGVVRVHHDAEADRISRSVAARAFTVGRDVYFSAGAYAPASHQGRRLLAHELAHVVQQGFASPVPGASRQP